MPYSFRRPTLAGLFAACALWTPAVAVAIDVPDPAWFVLKADDVGYYDSAAGLTGSALKLRLRAIVDDGDTVVSYDNARVSQRITDLAYGTNTFVGVYDRAVLPASGNTGWNREHVFPDSKIEAPSSNNDLFGLRPALTATNGGRGNNAFGGAYATGAPRLLPVNSGAKTAQFFAGDVDKGDVARAMFFMATRYSNLYLINSNDGLTAGNDTTTGDLDSLLHWHYQDLPDNFERRRNQLIYKNTVNTSPSLSQNNRNPYVDHPEYVWSAFGDRANDSQIKLAAADTTTAAGGSAKSVSFGRVIVGGVAPALSTNVAISKTGYTPTTFSVTTTGKAAADGTNATVRTNVYNGFDFNGGTKSLAVGLTNVSTAVAGRQSGSITLDNTDLTGGTGLGVNDGDDVLNLSLDVLDHSNASFSGASDQDKLFLNFDAVNLGQTATRAFGLTNLLAASGFTAGLDLDVINATGDIAAFATTMAAFSNLTAGASADFAAAFTPTTVGGFYAVYTLGVSDENIAGATSGSTLTLILSGVSAATTNGVPEPTLLAVVPLAAMLLRRRRAA